MYIYFGVYIYVYVFFTIYVLLSIFMCVCGHRHRERERERERSTTLDMRISGLTHEYMFHINQSSIAARVLLNDLNNVSQLGRHFLNH